jgi:hypothetical protein
MFYGPSTLYLLSVPLHPEKVETKNSLLRLVARSPAAGENFIWATNWFFAEAKTNLPPI